MIFNSIGNYSIYVVYTIYEYKESVLLDKLVLSM